MNEKESELRDDMLHVNKKFQTMLYKHKNKMEILWNKTELKYLGKLENSLWGNLSSMLILPE